MNLGINNSWWAWILLAVWAISSDTAAGQIVSLLQAASISSDAIRLSDLLPPDASNELRRAGEQIELGRSPQCHAVRVFEPPAIKTKISSSTLLHGLTVSGPVSVQRTCFPIRGDALQRVISEFAQGKDLELADSQLHWPNIDALQANPALEVEQVRPDPARAVLQIRLRCVEHTVCPSFWVAASTNERPHLPSAAAPAMDAPASPVLVKSGQRVMLVLEDPPLRIQLSVTCLQRGSLGKQVRAIDPSTHRIFQAKVTGAGMLMAHL